MDTTGTAEVNVVSGRITVTVPGQTDTDIHHGPGGTILGLAAEVEPWGSGEESMGRADAALADMGWRRTGEWAGSEVLTADVRPV
jgi:hypothetical protein